MRAFRSFLYTLAKLLGDVSAVGKGKVGCCVAQWITGKATSRALSKLFKEGYSNA